MANCKECKERRLVELEAPATIPYIVHESAMVRSERIFKRLWAVILILIALLVGTNIAWLIYESQFEVVETTEEYQIQQDGETNNSIINGGEIINGETNDKVQENNAEETTQAQ